MEHDIIVVSPENVVGNRDTVLLGPLAKVLRNPAFRARLSASMAAPIRRRLDYSSIARQVFSVEPMSLPAGNIFYWDPKEDK